MPPKFARIPDGADRHNARDIERQSLLDADSEEDDFFLNGPRVNTRNLQDPKMGRLREQVNDVVDVMKNNVNKVVDRGERLEDLQDKSDVINKVVDRGERLEYLQDKSDSLATNSDMFRSRAKALHKNMWWKNCKMKIIMALVILVILAVIIIPIVVSQVNKNKGN